MPHGYYPDRVPAQNIVQYHNYPAAHAGNANHWHSADTDALPFSSAVTACPLPRHAKSRPYCGADNSAYIPLRA